MAKRVLFTGGSGKAGRHVLPWLRDRGHHVTNIDRVPLGADGIDDLIADVTDVGQVFNVLTGYSRFADLEPGTGPKPYDAVVHFAAVPRILIEPDNETYRANVMGTYSVLEAATKLGIRKVIFASSETTYGVCFADGEVMPDYLPVDEEHPTVPMDSYGMSKVVGEATARSFQRRTGADIYGLRIGNVIEPHEYENFPGYFADPRVRRRNIFCYIDARDLGQIVHLCLETDGLGYQVFNAGNDTNSVDLPTREVAERFYPGVPFTREMGPHEALYDNLKIREMLGFEAQHDWRRYVPGHHIEKQPD